MDEVEETYLVMHCLDKLVDQNSIWSKNYSTYVAMTPSARVWWWRAAKKQAAEGVPAMQTLVAKFIELRMTS